MCLCSTCTGETGTANPCPPRDYCTHVLGGYPGQWVPAERHDEVRAALRDLYELVEDGGTILRPGSALDSRIRRVLSFIPH